MLIVVLNSTSSNSAIASRGGNHLDAYLDGWCNPEHVLAGVPSRYSIAELNSGVLSTLP